MNHKAMQMTMLIMESTTEEAMNALLIALLAQSEYLGSPKGFNYNNTLTLDGKNIKAKLSFSAEEIDQCSTSQTNKECIAESSTG